MLLSVLAPSLMGQQKLGSSGAGIGISIGSIFAFILGVTAVVINYRRNHSFFYAFLVFIFSEFYLAFVLIGAIIAKVRM